MKLMFSADFDGILDIQPGDSLEVCITSKTSGEIYEVNIIRQTGVRQPPPDLGVSVSDNAGISDRIG